MSGLSTLIRLDREFESFVSTLRDCYKKEEAPPIAINGLSGGAENAFIAEAVLESGRLSTSPALILVSSDEEAVRLTEALISFGIRAYHYQHREFIFNNVRASHDTERARLSVLLSMLSGDTECIVCTPQAASARTVPPSFLRSHSLSLKLGTIIDITELCQRLINMGYSPTDTTEGVGQFSHRGGIVDVFGGGAQRPVRIEFFGDEIDRMVYFDPITQRSEDVCECLSLLPASEVVVDGEARGRIKARVKSLLQAAKSDEARSRLTSEMNMIDGGMTLDFRDKYMDEVFGEVATIFDYVNEKTTVYTVGTGAVIRSQGDFYSSLSDEVKRLVSNELLSAKHGAFALDKAGLSEKISQHVSVHINSFAGGIGASALSGLFGFRCRKTVGYSGNPNMLIEDIRSLKEGGYKILITAENKQAQKSVLDMLFEADISAGAIGEDITPFITAPPKTVLVTLSDTEGYDLITPKIAVLSMREEEGYRIMAERRRRRLMKRAKNAGERVMSYADLSVGDYVVHVNYGIGQFEGIQTVTTMGVSRDYITIKYAGTDKLFVPCERLEMIGKYIGARDSNGEVKLSKMGGAEWTRAKNRAKTAARDMAKELVELYAKRQRTPGFAFGADTDLEEQFADSFEFMETESQLLAIDEIRRDMMRPVPMNRLLLGDVGFGKTEVALRAAFKAVASGKQVAILVPTTILALQHMQTACARMRDFPVSVEMLSGFRTPTEVQKILRRVKRGEIDILIGTHKLLSKNLEFRDLGLLIIDEEQRFGVAQKEKLRQSMPNVDTLILSATPIPRTLNMAMNGINDMSILEEPPGERRPVQSYVLEYDSAVINDAIERELNRSGQVLYLYNKVEDIHVVADHIAKNFPRARVAYAHGQMERDELEDIWAGLVRSEIDIIVCTTIIETGVDLPRANTLIIENADRFGLSQLHQIRGRVGRSERQAYAYFTYRPGKVISEVAEKRLRAIREFCEFGAGFKVAIRDLEIRGAGNLLGAQQHGYIESVGYDLYVKLLSEAVLDERGLTKEEPPSCLVDIKVSANIPESYVRTSAARMEMYKKISSITSSEDLSDIYDEMTDRFGNMPRATQTLLSVALVKALAEKNGVVKVEHRENSLVFFTVKTDFALWGEVMAHFPGLAFRAADKPMLVYRLKGTEQAVDMARKILEFYQNEKIKVGNNENEE